MKNSKTFHVCEQHLKDINNFFTLDKQELEEFSKKYISSKGVLKDIWNEMLNEKKHDADLPNVKFDEKYKQLGVKLNEVKQGVQNKFNILLPVIESVNTPQITCLNDTFNQALVNSGRAKDLTEASSIPRLLYCKCPKCHGRISF